MLSFVALSLAASLSVVDSIRIESRWRGLGTPSTPSYAIARQGDQYRRGSARVPQAAVDRFVAALGAAPVDRKAAIRALATPEWLRARATESHQGLFVPQCSPEAKQLLARHLVDPREAVDALDRYFDARWTDDSPRVSVTVTFHDGSVVRLESDNQPALMLPWKVGDTETWNPEIPRAIAGLLPDDAERRLTDRHLANEYVDAVARELRDSLDNLEERCVHRQSLAAVEKSFEVVRVYQGFPGWFSAYVR